ncbi:MAG: pyruvate kinase [Actinobacteria bacterium]|nr:pyruvate kinase [Actinomycetota bacterium]
METGKAKIVATLGPACREVGTLEAMIRGGMDVARINASHADTDIIRSEVEAVREAARRAGREVGIILDLMGPKLRVGEIAGGEVLLAEGSLLSLCGEPVAGDARRVSVNLPAFPTLVSVGDTLLLDDGAIVLAVEGVRGSEVVCRVVSGGVLRSRKGINLPGRRLPLPSLTEKDLSDLEAGVRAGVDWVALSFVRSPDDLEALRGVLRENGWELPLIAKVEKREAVQELEAVVEAADAVMVARGDLGVEMPLEEIPLLQKRIIAAAARRGKPAITATQMLQSMMESPTPTRAEVTDVANAVLDGSDAVMLSGETAVGAFPVEAVETMRRIVRTAEGALDYAAWLEERRRWIGKGAVEAVCMAACELALQTEASAIVTPTETGFTARQVSRLRPRQPILAPTPDPAVARRLNLYWGVRPLLVEVHGGVEETLDAAKQVAREEGLFAPGQTLVITAGLKAPGQTGMPTTNTIHCITA